MLETEVQTSYARLAVDVNFPLASVGVCTSTDVVIQDDHMGLSYISITSSNGACFSLFL